MEAARGKRVTPAQEQAIIEQLATVQRGAKTFDSWPEWEVLPGKTHSSLHYRAPIRIDGVLGNALVHLVTPQNAWEDEMIGQIEVRKPDGRSCWAIDTVEWKPKRQHVNNASAPADLRFLTLDDRIHPFGLNRRLGIGAFDQSLPRIGTELSRAIANFTEYCELCAEVWQCPDMKDVAPPTWLKSLV